MSKAIQDALDEIDGKINQFLSEIREREEMIQQCSAAANGLARVLGEPEPYPTVVIEPKLPHPGPLPRERGRNGGRNGKLLSDPPVALAQKKTKGGWRVPAGSSAADYEHARTVMQRLRKFTIDELMAAAKLKGRDRKFFANAVDRYRPQLQSEKFNGLERLYQWKESSAAPSRSEVPKPTAAKPRANRVGKSFSELAEIKASREKLVRAAIGRLVEFTMATLYGEKDVAALPRSAVYRVVSGMEEHGEIVVTERIEAGAKKFRVISPTPTRSYETPAVKLPSELKNVPPPAAPSPRPSPPGEGDETKPTSTKAIEIGKSFTSGFSPTDLGTRIPGDNMRECSARAYQWLSDWKQRQWIETIGHQLYKTTASFGQ